jgi:hypothetical protein
MKDQNEKPDAVTPVASDALFAAALEIANILEKFEGELSYTTSDDGIHLSVKGGVSMNLGFCMEGGADEIRDRVSALMANKEL